MKMVVAQVQIHLKKGVADPEGKNTKKALELLGFEVKGVKSIKTFDIELAGENNEETKARVEEMCAKLLANPVIHRYTITMRE